VSDTLAVAAAMARELVAQAPRLGLTWSMRPGTVQPIVLPYDPWHVQVVLDGDDASAPMDVSSLAGPLAAGMRVMVAAVPPSSWYALGVISADLNPNVIALTTSSASATGEAAVLTLPPVRLLPGAAYRIEAGSATLSGGYTYYQLRKGTTVSGAVLGAGGYIPGLGLAPSPGQWVTYIANRTTALITTSLTLTLTAVSSSTLHYANASTPRYLQAAYCGAATSYPQAVAVT